MHLKDEYSFHYYKINENTDNKILKGKKID